ncbi:hypothetical protein DFH06DRAFT_1137728 [Mycena polygramma]|nr:hypothetical protein DFH06DRAFT_1137728 [Mycena polygramma]
MHPKASTALLLIVSILTLLIPLLASTKVDKGGITAAALRFAILLATAIGADTLTLGAAFALNMLFGGMTIVGTMNPAPLSGPECALAALHLMLNRAGILALLIASAACTFHTAASITVNASDLSDWWSSLLKRRGRPADIEAAPSGASRNRQASSAFSDGSENWMDKGCYEDTPPPPLLRRTILQIRILVPKKLARVKIVLGLSLHVPLVVVWASANNKAAK